MTAIHLMAVGSASVTVMDRLSASLAKIFRVSCHVATGVLDIRTAYDPMRKQYHSTAILKQLDRLVRAPGIRLLGVTEYDLYVPVLTFVFGEAQLAGPSALVSLYRLQEEFYGLPPNERLLEERLSKEAVHELGHTFGLRHCPDWRCVMSSTHSVERLDLKGADFCSDCRRVVQTP
jgi:archaemetzincin